MKKQANAWNGCSLRSETVNFRWRIGLLSILGLSIVLSSTVFAHKHKHRSASNVCSPASNSTALQACVDATKAGGLLELAGGTWDFYTSNKPVRLTKSIHIRAKDPSNPPILTGDSNLLSFAYWGPEYPEYNDPPAKEPKVFNNKGFVIYDQRTNINGIEIEGLTFKNFFMAVSLSPELSEPTILNTGDVDNQEFVCNSTGTKKVRNVKIKDNVFDGNTHSVRSNGGNLRGIDILDNEMKNTPNGRSIWLSGRAVQCGVRDWIDGFGEPRDVVVEDNYLHHNDGGIEIFVENSPGVLVKDNVIEESYSTEGIIVYWDDARDTSETGPEEVGSIIGNEITSATWADSPGNIMAIGIEMGSSYGDPEELHVKMKKARISHNKIRGVRWTDIWLSGWANNIKVSDNDVDPETQYGRYGWEGYGANYIIDPDFDIFWYAYDNKLIIDASSTVLNGAELYHGVTNEIILVGQDGEDSDYNEDH